MLKKLFILPIKLYHWTISPLLGQNCRHEPSCSNYTIEAIKEWGILRGIILGMKRLSTCHPWGSSGYDPVPQKKSIEELEEGNTLMPQFHKRNGILPVAVQESKSGQILMLASVNEEALKYTLQHKIAAFYSTSQKNLWIKGESSGNYLTIDEVLIDCDQDALVYKVTLAKGGVCHTFNQYGKNRKACFYRSIKLELNTLEFIEK